MGSGSLYLLVDGLLYLLSTVLGTIAFNVSLNDALAAVKPTVTVVLWTRYLTN